jgi:tetratricopeptide (TPR) repeat protein
VGPLRPLLFCLFAGLLPAAALGQEPPPSGTPADETAQRLSDEGLEAYRAGKYETAARLYKQAFQVRGDPALLYNLARTYEKMGKPSLALEYYRRYLVAEGTDPKLRARAEERVSNLSSAAAPPPAQTQAMTPSAASPPPQEKDREKEKKPLNPGSKLLWAGVGLGAVGVAGLAVGIGLYGAAASAYGEFGATNDEMDKVAARDRAQRFAVGSAVGYAVGGALVASGAALIGVGLYKLRGERKASRVMILPLPGGAAASLAGAF